MAIVYRYIDLIDYIIKYIGISQDYNGFKGRVRDHYGQWWGKLSTYRIEYTEVATINDANCLEGHLIAYYETYKYFNKSKKKWGKCSWISDEDSIVWKEYIPDFKNTKVGNYTGNEERYDDRGRKLNRNEFQQKDGRYKFRYRDAYGRLKDVYSNRLTDEDETPTGKKVQQSLRALEKALEEQLTLDCCFKENIKLRKLKQSTLTNYKYIYERHIKPKFGCMFITDISHKMIKDHLISLIEDGFKPNSVECIYSILSPIFEMAVQRNIIVKNPVKYIMNEIKEEYGNFSKRLPLSDVEEMYFMEYIKTHKRYGSYYPLFSILLKTGCEAGEILGLTWDDVDIEKRTITISHKIIYRQQESGKCENHIIKFDEPKHIKIISIDTDIEQLLLAIRNCQNKMQFEGNNVVDGYSNFIFLNNCGNVQSTRGINRILSSIVNSYNGEEREIKMPKITTDILKLTYRKNMANQYLS